MKFLGIFGVKHNELFGKIVKIMLDMQTHFEDCIIVSQFLEKLKHTGLLGKKSQIVLDMLAHFEEKITVLGKKSIK